MPTKGRPERLKKSLKQLEIGSSSTLSPRQPRLQGLSITRLLPNIAPVIALCAGLSSIRFILLDRYEYALGAVIIAAFFDAMDGRLARLLGAASDFGAELDSLSDFVSFGVAPAIIMYLISLQHLGGIGWSISLIFAVCMGLRLARFNTHLKTSSSTHQPGWKKEFFTGVPAPAAAFLSLWPLALYLATGYSFFLNPILVGIWVGSAGLMAISRLPTYSFRNVHIPRRMVLPSLVLVGLGMAALLSDVWMTFSLLVFIYIGTIPLSIRDYSRHHRASSLKTETEITSS